MRSPNRIGVSLLLLLSIVFIPATASTAATFVVISVVLVVSIIVVSVRVLFVVFFLFVLLVHLLGLLVVSMTSMSEATSISKATFPFFTEIEANIRVVALRHDSCRVCVYIFSLFRLRKVTVRTPSFIYSTRKKKTTQMIGESMETQGKDSEFGNLEIGIWKLEFHEFRGFITFREQQKKLLDLA